MRRASRHHVTLVLFVMFPAPSCTQPASVPPTGIVQALKDYSTQHCDIQSIVEHSGLYRSSSLAVARAWLHRLIAENRHRHIHWARHDPFRSVGELDIAKKGLNQHLWWDDYHPVDIPERDQLVVRTCVFATRKIDVIDTDLDTNEPEIRVLFQPKLGYSPFGEELKHLGLLVGNNSFEPVKGYERVAWLRNMPGGRWKVVRMD